MERDLVDYLIQEYSHKLSRPSLLMFQQFLDYERLAAAPDESTRTRMRAEMIRACWLANGEDLLALYENKTPAFREQIAQKIYAEHGGDALLNNCPRCYRLARTSRAKQCRHCGHDWH